MYVQVNIICSLNPAHLPAHKLLRKLFACLFVCLRKHTHTLLTRSHLTSVYLTYRIETVNKFRYQQLVCFSPPGTSGNTFYGAAMCGFGEVMFGLLT